MAVADETVVAVADEVVFPEIVVADETVMAGEDSKIPCGPSTAAGVATGDSAIGFMRCSFAKFEIRIDALFAEAKDALPANASEDFDALWAEASEDLAALTGTATEASKAAFSASVILLGVASLLIEDSFLLIDESLPMVEVLPVEESVPEEAEVSLSKEFFFAEESKEFFFVELSKELFFIEALVSRKSCREGELETLGSVMRLLDFEFEFAKGSLKETPPLPEARCFEALAETLFAFGERLPAGSSVLVRDMPRSAMARIVRTWCAELERM